MEEWKKRLAEAISENGLSQTDFAKLIGVSDPTVSHWLKSVNDGGIRDISAKNLLLSCLALGITAEWVMEASNSRDARNSLWRTKLGREPDQNAIRGGWGEQDRQDLSPEERQILLTYSRANDVGRNLINSIVQAVDAAIESVYRKDETK